MNHNKTEKRFNDLVNIIKNSDVDSKDLLVEKFYLVFGNLMQEYFADLIYEEVEGERDWNASAIKSFKIADKLFGGDPFKDWPFHREWLNDYIRWRYLGPRQGTSKEDKRSGGLGEFKERNPITDAQCNWYLGCNIKDNLEADHIRAWKLHGSGSAEEYQWLCKKHNNDWKKTLLFWGDNFIPFRNFVDEEQQM